MSFEQQLIDLMDFEKLKTLEEYPQEFIKAQGQSKQELYQTIYNQISQIRSRIVQLTKYQIKIQNYYSTPSELGVFIANMQDTESSIVQKVTHEMQALKKTILEQQHQMSALEGTIRQQKDQVQHAKNSLFAEQMTSSKFRKQVDQEVALRLTMQLENQRQQEQIKKLERHIQRQKEAYEQQKQQDEIYLQQFQENQSQLVQQLRNSFIKDTESMKKQLEQYKQDKVQELQNQKDLKEQLKIKETELYMANMRLRTLQDKYDYLNTTFKEQINEIRKELEEKYGNLQENERHKYSQQAAEFEKQCIELDFTKREVKDLQVKLKDKNGLVDKLLKEDYEKKQQINQNNTQIKFLNNQLESQKIYNQDKIELISRITYLEQENKDLRLKLENEMFLPRPVSKRSSQKSSRGHFLSKQESYRSQHQKDLGKLNNFSENLQKEKYGNQLRMAYNKYRMSQIDKQIKETLEKLLHKLHMKRQLQQVLYDNILVRQQEKSKNNTVLAYLQSLLSKEITQADITPAIIATPVIPVIDNDNRLKKCEKCGQKVPFEIIYQCGHKFCCNCQFNDTNCATCNQKIQYRLIDTSQLRQRKDFDIQYLCPNKVYQCNSSPFQKIYDLERHYTECPYTIILKNFSIDQLDRMPTVQPVQNLLKCQISQAQEYLDNILKINNKNAFKKDLLHPEVGSPQTLPSQTRINSNEKPKLILKNDSTDDLAVEQLDNKQIKNNNEQNNQIQQVQCMHQSIIPMIHESISSTQSIKNKKNLDMCETTDLEYQTKLLQILSQYMPSLQLEQIEQKLQHLQQIDTLTNTIVFLQQLIPILKDQNKNQLSEENLVEKFKEIAQKLIDNEKEELKKRDQFNKRTISDLLANSQHGPQEAQQQKISQLVTQQQELMNKQQEEIKQLQTENMKILQDNQELQQKLHKSEFQRQQTEQILYNQNKKIIQEFTNTEKDNAQLKSQIQQRNSSKDLMQRISNSYEIREGLKLHNEGQLPQKEKDLNVNELKQQDPYQLNISCDEDSEDFVKGQIDEEAKVQQFTQQNLLNINQLEDLNLVDQQKEVVQSLSNTQNEHSDNTQMITIANISNQKYNKQHKINNNKNNQQQKQYVQQVYNQPNINDINHNLGENYYPVEIDDKQQNNLNQKLQDYHQRIQQQQYPNQKQIYQNPEITISTLQTSRAFPKNKNIILSTTQHNTDNINQKDITAKSNSQYNKSRNIRSYSIESSANHIRQSSFKPHLSYVRLFQEKHMAQQLQTDDVLARKMNQRHQELFQLLARK